MPGSFLVGSGLRAGPHSLFINIVYQVVSGDGSRYEAAEIAVLQEWAREGRITPETTLRDPVRALEFKAGEVPELQGCFLPVVRQEVLPPEAWAPSAQGSILPGIALALASVSLCTGLVGLFPCLGWVQWFTLLLGGTAHILAWASLLTEKLPRSRGSAIVALVMSFVILVIGGARLALGGGCF